MNEKQFFKDVKEKAEWIYFHIEQENFEQLLPNKNENEGLTDNEKSINDLLSSSEEFLKKKDVKEKICAALINVGDDLYKILEKTSPILLPLAISLVLPMNSYVFAAIAIVIYRAGIKFYCTENSNV